MTRRVGTIVALLALAATASADKVDARKPAAKAGAKQPAPPADGSGGAPGDGSAAAPTAAEIEALLPPHVNGPKVVDLGHNTQIDVPAGMVLFEKAEAQKMLQKGGDTAETAVAVIGKLDAEWMVVIEYDDVGYINDDDADKLDAGEILKQYQEGTKQQNERRRSLGVAELTLDGWSEPPRYEKAKHHLVWGLKGHSTDGQVINFFTRILGRNGFLSVNLIDAPDRIEKSKVDVMPILSATGFKPGFTYEEHAGGDKDSGIGLRALVLGGAGIAVLKVAKIGILAKLLFAFKAGFKFIALAIAGFFAWIRRGFKRKPKDAPPQAPAPPSDPNNPPVG